MQLNCISLASPVLDTATVHFPQIQLHSPQLYLTYSLSIQETGAGFSKQQIFRFLAIIMQFEWFHSNPGSSQLT
jgi:hypothetical protein